MFFLLLNWNRRGWLVISCNGREISNQLRDNNSRLDEKRTPRSVSIIYYHYVYFLFVQFVTASNCLYVCVCGTVWLDTSPKRHLMTGCFFFLRLPFSGAVGLEKLIRRNDRRSSHWPTPIFFLFFSPLLSSPPAFPQWMDGWMDGRRNRITVLFFCVPPNCVWEETARRQEKEDVAVGQPDGWTRTWK